LRVEVFWQPSQGLTLSGVVASHSPHTVAGAAMDLGPEMGCPNHIPNYPQMLCTNGELNPTFVRLMLVSVKDDSDLLLLWYGKF